MLDSTIKTVVLEQKESTPRQRLIERSLFPPLCASHQDPGIVIISGMRRTGKSTLLYQLGKPFPGYYLNFDDERLISYSVEDFQRTDEIFHEIYGELDTYYFDEIQNVPGWERFVRRLHDHHKKIYITGSNAHLMSKDLGTHLTGRYYQVTLYPFSFSEFFKFKEIEYSEKDFYTTRGRSKIMAAFNDYLYQGGIPEFLQTQNRDYLQFLYESILYRDIIVKNNIRNDGSVKELMLFVFSNIGKSVSFNKLADALGVKNATTIKDYFSHLEESYMVMLCRKFSYSAKNMIKANKKVYSIDNGMAHYLGLHFSGDYGRLLENLVFLELKRRNKDVYYYSEKNECDFVVKEGRRILQGIQVCYELTDDNRDREVNGLLDVIKEFDLKEGLLLTHSREDEIRMDRKKIQILPVWKWLLE